MGNINDTSCQKIYKIFRIKKLQPIPLVKQHEWTTVQAIALMNVKCAEIGTTASIRYYRKPSNLTIRNLKKISLTSNAYRTVSI